MPQPPKVIYLCAGTLIKPDDSWCDTCRLPSLLGGALYRISMAGVTLWGTVMGCPECNNWVRKNLRGEILKVKNEVREEDAND